MYFESLGQVKMTHLNWNLVTYVDLATPIYKFLEIRSQYEKTVEISKQMNERFGSTEIASICEQFIQLFTRVTLPHLYEIKANHRNMMLSIGYTSLEGQRTRRGLSGTIQRVANVLYGIYSKIDAEFVFDKILALSVSKDKNINIIPERMRIVQAETNHHIKQLSQHHQKLEENLKFLQGQTKQII